jgi:hypothetical protein
MALSFTLQNLAILLITVSQVVAQKLLIIPWDLVSDIIICSNSLQIPEKRTFLIHEHRSSAYYNAQNELINVVTINSSQEWQDYFWKTWADRSKHPLVYVPIFNVRLLTKRNRKDYDPKTISLFAKTLKDIQSATETTLSHPVEIRSITAPTHFQEGSSIFNIRRATTSLRYFPEKHYNHIILLHEAARLAHNLDNCKTFVVEEGCDIFHENNYAFVVEYSPQYLVFNFVDITNYICIPEGRRKLPWNGEVENGGVS